MTRWKQRVRTVVALLAYAGAPALIVVTLLLRFVGEDWWVTTVALYLPRAGFALPLLVTTPLLLLFGLRRLLWTQLVALAILIFPLMGFVVSWPFHAARGPTLRVLSYNMHAVDKGAGAIVAEVKRYSPDVVLLQEVANTPELLDGLRAEYPVVEMVEEQFLVASRYPARASAPPLFEFAGHPHHARYTRQVVDTPLGAITFFNVHPVSPRMALLKVRGRSAKLELVTGHVFVGKGAKEVIENAALRRAALERASEAAALETGPVVIAGDTNLPGLSAVFARNLGRYQDGFSAAGFGFGYTFPVKLPWMRLDRIVASDQLEFMSFTQGCGGFSDHHCVVAELARR